jgi:serine O-acetyltransferase
MLLYTKIYRLDVWRSQILLASSTLEPCNPLREPRDLNNMFTPVKRFFDLVAQDAKVYGRERPSILFYIAALLGLSKFSAVLLYRVDSTLYDKGLPWSVLAALMRRWNQVLNACDIFPQATIGPGLHVPHPMGVGVGPIKAGRNMTILQNVCLTLKDRRQLVIDSYPRFGDNVTVGANATVVGSVVIGDGVVIGASACVLKDVPAGCRAVGNPARVLQPKTPSLQD